MPRYFTTYWKNARWKQKRRDADGRTFIHTAGSDFRQRGVDTGDFLYIVTVLQGQLYLAGRLKVDSIVDQQEAERLFAGHFSDEPLYEATDHVLARDEDGIPFDFHRAVPAAVARRLTFLRSGKPPTGLTFEQGDMLDQQTLRTTRELTPTSAELLDSLLD